MAALGIGRPPIARAAGESVQFGAAAFSVSEADGSALITVTISPTPTDPLTISVVSSDGSASGVSDYAPVNSTFNINPGVAELTFTVSLTDDGVYEGNETLTLSLTEVISGNIGAPGAATLTINDDETQPSVAWSAAGFTVGEAGGSAAITATLSGQSAFTVTVNAATGDNTATSPADYTAVSTLLTFAPGATQAVVNVPIANDSLYEGSEALTLTLSTPANAALGTPSAAALAITDNETQPTVQLSASSYSGGEGAGSQIITATLSGASAFPASVTISSTDGTASGASDYTPINRTLSFAPGATLTTTTVAITDDTLYENTETFSVALSNPGNTTLGSPSSASVQITNNDALPILQLSAITQTVSEGVGTVTVTAALNTLSGLAASAPFSVGGTATGGGTDHSLANGIFSVPAGSLANSVTFTVADDALNEDNETVIVTLGAPTNAALGATTVQTITLQDNDPLPQISINDVAVAEGNAGTVNAVFTVSLLAPSGRTVSVSYATANGAATSPADFVGASGALTFTPGVTTQPVTITVNGDTLDEDNETFTVGLSGPVNAAISDGSGLGTITDDDPLPGLSIGDVSVTEGDGGSVNAVFTVTLAPVSGRVVTVNYATANLTATAPGDYTAASGTLTFTAGITTQTVTVAVQGDALDEDDETFAVNLSSPANATLSDAAGLGTILDNDPAPSLSMAPSVVVNETDAGTVNAVFTVTLSAASGRVVTVNYATSDNTAVSPFDFVAASGTLTFTPGVTARPITVTVQSDLLDEIDETFLVTLSGPVNASVASGLSIGTILDNDPTPALTINNVTVAEGNSGTTSAVFTVTLSAPSGRTVSVDYATADITATAPTDYGAVSGALTFNPGTTTQTITVTVNGDLLDEADETYAVNLSSPANATLADGAGLGTITDDDPTPALTINNVTVTEGNSGPVNAVFTVTLSAPSGRAVAVNYATANLTATAPADYTAQTGTLNFAPGTVTQAITVAVQGDLLDEVDETFVVNLASPVNATIADSQGLGTILDDDPTPSLTINNVTVTEGNSGSVNAVFTVTLSAASGQVVSVNYATANLTATAPADYTAQSGVLTFTAGVAAQAITIAVQGDLLDEVDETFAVNLTSPVNATLADSQGLGTITDDDPTPSLSINDATVTEGNSGTTSAVFTVTLSAASGRAVSVNYATADNTAVSPADYASLSGTLNFAPGDSSETITITVNGDAPYELTETFSVSLSGPVNATLSDSAGLGTITNDDAAPTLSINDVALNEGNSGTSSAVFTVTLTGATQVTATVNYATVNGTATAGTDFNAASGPLTFPPGDTTEAVTVTILGDTDYEFTEAFTLSLSAPAEAQFGDAVGVGTLTNDDAAPTLSISDVALNEGNSGTTSAVFTVTLSGATALPATVAYATANGTATAGTDYLAASGTLTFPVGVTTQFISVTVNGDATYENTETFTVTLSSPGNATITDNQGIGTLTNDDALPTLAINDVAVAEGNAGSITATFTVTLSGATALPVSVAYATASGTATAGADYLAASGTITFSPGVTAQAIPITVQGDLLDEPDETFTVTLSSPSGATVTDSVGLGTITDDDPTPSLTINNVTVAEGNSGPVNAVFTVTLSAASGRAVSVNYATANLTATAPADYASLSGTLNFAPGATSQTITVTVNGDVLDEDNETFAVNLTSPVNATIADAQGLGTITDDDSTPSLSINDATVAEGNSGPGTAAFTVTLSAVSGRDVAVLLATSDLTASAPADYLAVNTVLTFTPGITLQTVLVTINGDTLDEDDETYAVVLSAPVNAALADTTGLGVILDDDATPSIAITDQSLTEGNSGSSLMQFTANLSAPSGRTVTLNYATADLTATAGADYLAASGVLTFTPGAASADITVTILGDTLDEVDETLAVNLSNPVNALLPDTQAIGTLLDDDPTPTLSIANASVAETNTSAALVFTVTLSAASGQSVNVNYATADGTASAPADYVAASGTLTFTPGLTTRTLTVTVQGDTFDEANETLVVNLSNPVNAGLIASQGAGTILDDDPTPTLQFSSASQTVSEGVSGGAASVTVTLSSASGFTVTVPYTVSGTATGADHTLANGQFTVNPLALSAVLTFTIVDDALDENNETVILTLGAPVNASPGSPAVHTLTLSDNDSPPAVRLSASAFAAPEDGGPAVLTATLTGPSGLTATAAFTTSNGTALAGSDYAATTGVITFTPGLTLTTFTVPLTADTTYESGETFSVTLGSPVNATLGSPASGVVTITNDDALPAVQFETALFSVSEDSGGASPTPSTAIVSATLSNPSAFTITVDYSTTAGTASSGVDYLDTSGTLTFAPGQTTRAFSVTTVVDQSDELLAEESVLLALGNPNSNATLGALASATLNIVDNDGTPTVRFGSATVNVNEGAGPANLAVSLSNPSDITVTVDVRSTNGTAAAGLDYTAISETITFTPGDTSAIVTVPITDDNIYENNETFTVTLSNPAPPGALVLAPSITSTQVTIVNNDTQPAIQFSAAAFQGSELANAAVVTMTLSRPSALNTRVTYTTSDGAALAASDYAARSVQVTFSPGVTTLTATIPITNDATYEGAETFNVTLSGPVNGALGAPSAAVITIADNDSPPVIQFSAASYSRLESGGTVVLTATLTGTTAVTASVNYATANGTAVAPGDYTAQSGTLTFPPGDATDTITITLANGAVYEGDETFTVTLSAPVSATLGAPSAATVVILENDAAPTLRLSLAGDTASEGVPITISVVLSGNTAVPARVNYATVNGTALASSDYAARSGTLIFNPGTSLLTFTIPITNDLLYELDETFSVVLSAPISATLTSPSAATYTILLNNNGKPEIQLSAASFVVGENIGAAVITTTLAPVSAVTATVNYATSNLTATAGSDYTPVSGTLTFTPGLTRTTFSIPITDDVLLENNEWLNVSLSSPGAATLGITSTATVNIANNDPQTGCVIYNSTNVPLAIPDNNALGITSTLTIPGPGHVITDVSVRVENIQHTWVGDLQITIISPSGQSVRLFRGIGAGGDNLLFTIFNDAGTGFLGASAPFTGKFRPEGTGAGQLSTFDNQISPGIWRLNVADLASQDTGTLNAWGLEICGPARAPYQVFLPLIRR